MASIGAFRSSFQPRNDDVLLTSFPKTGTTWLKALCYNILNLDEEEEEDILAKNNRHRVVPTLEMDLLQDHVQDVLLNSSSSASTHRRLLHTHFPYSYLPDKVKSTPGCKLVYVARNPKDTLVSMWHFCNKLFVTGDLIPLEGAVESFCSGVMPFGPFYEHVVGFWEESEKRPHEVLFLKYEELCRNPEEQVRKLASFLGKPFRKGGADGDAEVGKVLWRRSLNRLKELEVNKSGFLKEEPFVIRNSIYFRNGAVGDWKNHLTTDMAQRIDRFTQAKFQGTGLSLDDHE